MKTEENNWKVWQELHQHPWVESVHLPLAAPAWNSGLSKFTPAPFSRLVKSCWQACMFYYLCISFFSLMWDVRAQHETVWNFSWPGCEERGPGMACHVLGRIEPDPDVLGRGEKMTEVWAITWLLKSFWDGKGPSSPAEAVFVPSGYRFQMIPSLWRGANPGTVE